MSLITILWGSLTIKPKYSYVDCCFFKYGDYEPKFLVVMAFISDQRCMNSAIEGAVFCSNFTIVFTISSIIFYVSQFYKKFLQNSSSKNKVEDLSVLFLKSAIWLSLNLIFITHEAMEKALI